MKVENKIPFLERENELLNSIIQGASDPIYAKDLEGRYLSINEAGAKRGWASGAGSDRKE